MQHKRFRGADARLLLQEPGSLPFKCPAREGERKDKKLLPTPLNILDKNNDCVNLTLTSPNLFLPYCWPGVKKRLEHTIFQEPVYQRFIPYAAVTCGLLKTSPRRGRGTVLRFQRGSRESLCRTTTSTPRRFLLSGSLTAPRGLGRAAGNSECGKPIRGCA